MRRRSGLSGAEWVVEDPENRYTEAMRSWRVALNRGSHAL